VVAAKDSDTCVCSATDHYSSHVASPPQPPPAAAAAAAVQSPKAMTHGPRILVRKNGVRNRRLVAYVVQTWHCFMQGAAVVLNRAACSRTENSTSKSNVSEFCVVDLWVDEPSPRSSFSGDSPPTTTTTQRSLYYDVISTSAGACHVINHHHQRHHRPSVCVQMRTASFHA